ncbi:putative transmembrane efflux protein [Actinacidiphila reveromycinica]|uniref:Putative transmembrane efflux protein n=1 Tax=Actinacidiphila reveromycinica TaxID=659352 RepID=A0A7U3URH0_9ACTN|nr:MFS transporter [Streptomyces sp. SN-593]BBA97338.1 putative transmembrane efflux protein [Streptomyces sp. SN-593]
MAGGRAQDGTADGTDAADAGSTGPAGAAGAAASCGTDRGAGKPPPPATPPPRSLGRPFGWLWAAYAVSAYGTGFGFGAFALLAILVLHAGAGEVSALSAAGLAVGAVAAVPLGPWVEFHRKRPVMVATDLVRFAAMASLPVAYACGRLGFVQLLVVSVVVATAKIAFRSASGAYLKSLVRPEHLLVANGRFESTTWSATVLGPPLGGAAIGLFGPVTTVAADAVSYLLSALGVGAIRGKEPDPRPRTARVPAPDRQGRGTVPRPWHAELLDGWRHILAHPPLRLLFLNTLLLSALLLATEPLLAVLMLGRLGFAPWQYGLAFALPCTGGLLGARLSRRLVARYGSHRVLVVSGALRACWPLWLAFTRPGAAGIALVVVAQFGLVTSIGVFNPVLATYRLEQTASGHVARTLSAWTVTGNLATAALTALWGLLAAATSPRLAIGAAGLLILATPLLLPRRATPPPAPAPAAPPEAGPEAAPGAV